MTVSHVLLGILADGPAHGYDLKRVHDQRFSGARPLAFGQVYAALSKLERDGLAVVAGTATDGGPERTTYAITEEGRASLDSWLATSEPAGPYAADEMVRKVVTALALGAGAVDVLDRQRATHLAEMRRLLAEQTAATDVSTRIVLDHAVSHLDADLRWLETSADRLRTSQGAPR
jgi:DNA-binding PadR family transcriptional regulator